MPRYFFDITDGERQPDATGIDLPDLAEARGQAFIALAGVLLPKAGAGVLGPGRWRIEARDEAGAVLFTLDYREGAASR